MSVDLSMFHDGDGIELPKPETKPFNEVVMAVSQHANTDSDVPSDFANMYILGVQWEWFYLYKEWDLIRQEAEGGSFTPPDMPVRPEQETTNAVLDRASDIVFSEITAGSKARSGEQTVLAGNTYTPDIALNLEYINMDITLTVIDVDNSLLNAYKISLINRPSGVETVSVVEMGSVEHNFTDSSTISAVIGDGQVRLVVPTTGSGESLLINYDVTYAR